ncbi:hypothetical protein [Methylobacterium brachiatum]|nr:hypothetical protein [Methylobacterium brachiatum]
MVKGLIDLAAASVKQSVKQGWECPRCRAILAPHVERCTCKATA